MRLHFVQVRARQAKSVSSPAIDLPRRRPPEDLVEHNVGLNEKYKLDQSLT